MKRTILFLSLALAAVSATAQTLSGKVVDDEGKPLEAVSVVVTGEGNRTLAFGYSKADGTFSLAAKGEARAVNFSMMGFEKVSVPVGDFRSGQTVTLRSRSFVLKAAIKREKSKS